jgi:penicillin amidase
LCSICTIILLSGILFTIYFGFKIQNILRIRTNFAHNHEKYGNITIYRDTEGVPHILAKDYKSGCYGLGFSQATDRLWQMHFNRLLNQGRLS